MDSEQQIAIDMLEELITMAEYVKKCYKTSSDDVLDRQLRKIFDKYYNQKSFYIIQLQEQIAKEGGHTKISEDLLNTLRSAWVSVKTTFAFGDHRTLINYCIKAEEKLLANYKKVLKNSLSGYVRLLLENQLSGTEEALNELRKMKTMEE
jgi:uncharacterized protein (TIGR02284 family)